jgi:hypothetical protein
MEVLEKQERFVGASGKNGRRREIVRIDSDRLINDVIASFGCDRQLARETVVREVMLRFRCDRKTARATVERGYYIVNYHKKTIYPGSLDTESAYKLAWFIYRRKFEHWLPWYVGAEDLVQEGVTRLFEMAGHPRFREKGFQFYLALNAMKGWIERQRRMRGGIGGTTPGYEEAWQRNAGNDWQGAMAAA